MTMGTWRRRLSRQQRECLSATGPCPCLHPWHCCYAGGSPPARCSKYCLFPTPQPNFPLYSAQEALEEYRMLMQTADDVQLNEQLLLGATLIACHRHPLLRYSLVVEQLDDLAVQVGAWGVVGGGECQCGNLRHS